MNQYYVLYFGLMMAEWAETCPLIVNFLILITNICCVYWRIKLLYYCKHSWMAPVKEHYTAYLRAIWTMDPPVKAQLEAK